jgi:hypothetical protein
MFSRPEHQLEVSGQLHAPAALSPEKEPPVPSGWTQSQSRRYGEVQVLDPTRTRTPAPQSSRL